MVLSRVAEAGGRGAGGFLGGVANNPGIVAIAAIIAVLVLFRGDIRNAFGSLGEAASNFGSIQLPDIQLPTINFPEITFPTFEFPTFEFPTIEFPTFELPTVELPDVGSVVTETFAGATMGVTDFFAGLQTMFNEFVSGFGGESMPTQGDFTDVGQAGARSARGSTGVALESEQQFAEIMQRMIDTGVTIAPTIETIAPFVGGGPSFIGGTIFETPIENLSLFQIIDRFMVSATEAANIREIARDFTPEEESFLSQGPSDIGGFVSGGPPATSSLEFEGLDPAEIAIRTTGGNILNF